MINEREQISRFSKCHFVDVFLQHEKGQTSREWFAKKEFSFLSFIIDEQERNIQGQGP